MKIKTILSLLLLCAGNSIFGFQEEVKTLFSDAKICISEKICKALAPQRNLEVNEQVVTAIKNQDLATLMSLEPQIDRLNLQGYIELAQHKARSPKVKAGDNALGLFKVFLGSSFISMISTYVLLKVYNDAITDSNDLSLTRPFTIGAMLSAFGRPADETTSELMRSLAAKFIDIGSPVVIGCYLIADGVKSLQIKPSNRVLMQRLAIVAYLNNLHLSSLDKTT